MPLTPEQIAKMDSLVSPSLSTEKLTAMDRLASGVSQESMGGPTIGQRVGALTLGALDTVTMGLSDEAMAYVKSLVDSGVSYDDALAQARGRQQYFESVAPGTYFGGQVGGAFVPATGSLGAMTKGVRGALQSRPVATAAGIGAVEGGVYGFGSGEGGAAERAQSATEGAAFGGVGGVAGAGAAKYGRALLDRARSLFPSAAKGTPSQFAGAQPQEVIESVATRVDVPQAVEPSVEAVRKVKSALTEDLGKDLDTVLDAYKKGDVSLAELYGNRSTSLAKGAAQYPAGQKGAQEFFDMKTGGSYERILNKIKKNVTDLDAYFTSADDIFNAGKAKARPLYDEAYESVVDVELAPEVVQAIKRARRQFPSELDGLPDNSVKTLDYAKRVLDDDIGAAVRAGRANLARSRTGVKNSLLSEIDAQVPSYAKARKISGDYLSIRSAIEDGRAALRRAPEDVAVEFKGLTEPEKIAFRHGLGKAVREEVAKVSEGVNPYKRILGSHEKKKRLASVLSLEQFRELNRTLRAEDRLFKMRNEVLGGSPTASKLEAKNLIASTAQGVDNALQVPRRTMTETLNGFFDGLNDKTAGKVSEILYETDPAKKLKILEALGKTKKFTPAERKIVKETYFNVMPVFDVTRAVGAGVGGISSAASSQEERR